MIARVPLFAELDAGEIADIMQLLRAQVAEAGEVIVREARRRIRCILLPTARPRMALHKRENVTLTQGQFFGEVAVLKRAPRSATATALSRTSLLALDADDLRALMKRDKRIAQRIKDVAEKRTGHSAPLRPDEQDEA